jgi:molybdenum cofactor biosynthesis protein B
VSDPRPDLAHKAAAPKKARFMVVTVSDSRTPETDDSGRIIERLVREAGHARTLYRLVKDDPEQVAEAIRVGGASDEVDVIVLNGGTGMSSRDGTFETVSAMLEKPMPGFGELFRMLSWEQVGSAAMLSRATAGLYRGKAVFSIPGSPKAAQLAMSRLILPEAGHLLFEARR